MTAIDELQAAVHRALTPVASQMTSREYRHSVDAILEAAQKYAASEYAAIPGRLAVLERATRSAAAHFGTGIHPACGSYAVDPVVTLSRLHVTCGACKRTRAWKETT